MTKMVKKKKEDLSEKIWLIYFSGVPVVTIAYMFVNWGTAPGIELLKGGLFVSLLFWPLWVPLWILWQFKALDALLWISVALVLICGLMALRQLLEGHHDED